MDGWPSLSVDLYSRGTPSKLCLGGDFSLRRIRTVRAGAKQKRRAFVAALSDPLLIRVNPWRTKFSAWGRRDHRALRVRCARAGDVRHHLDDRRDRHRDLGHARRPHHAARRG